MNLKTQDKIYERYWGEKLVEQAAAAAAAAATEKEENHHNLSHEKQANSSDPQNQDTTAITATIIKQEAPAPTPAPEPAPTPAPDLKPADNGYVAASEKNPSLETTIPRLHEQSSPPTVTPQGSGAAEAQPSSIS